MGTKAIIEVAGIDFASVYQHWDGDPDHTMPWLKAFNNKFTDDRGDDPAYKFAQLLRAKAFDLDDSLYTGWGVVPFNAQMGQEYTYTLYGDGTVAFVAHNEDTDLTDQGLINYDAVF
jgi:hypothetical protein